MSLNPSFPQKRESFLPFQYSVAGDEAVEGLDESALEGGTSGDYPLNTVLIRTNNRTIHDILRRIKSRSFIMNPEFQRDFVWSVKKQSKLIESVIMRIPLPVFYFAEDRKGRMIIVDGRQRLHTFQRFVKNEFALRLKGHRELDGKRFKDLSVQLQNRIEDCNLILYIIDEQVPERARLDIFERVNSGEPLSRQQMRNSLYTGKATRFLETESNSKIFIKATGGGLQHKTMRNREFVNRFCAFQLLNISDYRDMDDFLAKALITMNDDPNILPSLSKQFRRGLKNNHSLFGPHAFRKLQSKSSRRSVINAALWDVMSTGLSRYPKHTVQAYSTRLKREYRKLLCLDKKFVRSISLSTSGVRQVRYRFNAARKMLSEVFGD